MKPRILIVEDDASLAAGLDLVCSGAGFATELVYAGRPALEKLGRQRYAGVVLDIGLPDLNGIAVLEKLRATDSATPVIVVTAHGSLENAKAARSLGVHDILIKPFDVAAFESAIRSFAGAPAEALAPTGRRPAGSLLIGVAPALQRALVRLAQASATDAPVLVTGPSGCGKTLAARVLHANSPRAAHPLIAVECSGPAGISIEDELFDGAEGRRGAVERAAGGTLVIEEVADLPPAIQVLLLRLMDERVCTRAGGRRALPLDARIVATTSRDLRAEARAGRFRRDLHERLRVLEVVMPPLRERLQDIPLLCDFFLAATAPERGLQINDEARRALLMHAWPGNVGELRYAIEHAAAVAPGRVILPQHLPESVRSGAATPGPALDASLHAWLDRRLTPGTTYDELHDEIEAALLRDLMRRHAGRPSVLARVLQMNRVTLLSKRRRYGLGER
jgi:DNA-binding NtrC family response regulator